jgi:hypothetical protein
MYLLSNIYSIPVSGILNWVYLFFGTFLVLINQLGFSVPPLELFTVYAISVVMTAFVALSLYKEISTTKRDRRWLLSLLLLSLKTLKEKLKRMPWPFKLIPLLGLIGAVYPDNLPNVADFSKSLPIIGDFNPNNNPNPGRGWFPWGEPVAGTPTVGFKTPWASLAKLGSDVYGGVTQVLGSDYSDLKEGVLKPFGIKTFNRYTYSAGDSSFR